MAVVQGIREKVHLPLYDSVSVDKEEQLFDVEKSGTLKFFVNVQGKTKLQTNLQSASLLPHYNTFEARAMRVVISDLPPEFPDDDKKDLATTDDLDVEDDNGNDFDPTTGAIAAPGATSIVTATVETTVDGLSRLYKELADSDDGEVDLDANDPDVTLNDSSGNEITGNQVGGQNIEDIITDAGGTITLTRDDLDDMNDSLKAKAIPKEQTDPNNGSGTIIGKLVYNTVTSLFVGEKVMISMPTWFFPAGAGPYSETGKFTTHGEPSPTATFRFAEPIYIDKQQNFRVEIEVPDSDVLKDIQKIYGPLNIWVVLDGYMTRDVQ
ncbi:MAG TPA: hypothetical protein VMN56_02545 [Casimicrobiaceae bacterium]|nr:hypothetical protein [Casimicrobiaceae bacterium]